MPTFLSRKYLRGKPRATERLVGAALVVLLGALVAAFLLTGGLFASVVNRTPVLHSLKDWIGVSEQPLFAVPVEMLAAPAATPEQRRAELTLPSAAPPWERQAVNAFTVKPGQTANLAAQASRSLPWSGSNEPFATDVFARQLEAAGARSVYVGLYQLPSSPKEKRTGYQALVAMVDAGDPKNASDLRHARDPGKSTPLKAGCSGWQANPALSCGFWAGRYYTEIQASGQDADLGPMVQAIASSQLVYGEPVAGSGAPAHAAVGKAATAPAAPAAPGPARFAEVPGGDILPPAVIERYTDNLYEKIDGKEPMFRGYFFAELRFARYQDSRQQDVYDVYLFDMTEPANAMGIYMAERGRSVRKVELGRDGYVSGTSAYFWKGKYYVNVLGPPEGGEAAAEVSRRIAAAVAGTIADAGEPFWAEPYLPAADRVSVGYQATSALGNDFLGRVFLASYKAQGKSYQLYVTKAADAAGAAELFAKSAAATAKYDKVLSRQQSDAGETLVGESIGVFSVAFHKGVFFGGVTECEDQALAVKQAAALRDSLPADAKGDPAAATVTPAKSPAGSETKPSSEHHEHE